MERVRTVTVDWLAKSVVHQMRAAGRLYQSMTLGWAAWSAPEAFYRDFVAMKLYNERIHSTPEITIGSLRGLRREQRGQPPKTSGQRRIDLVVWNNNSTPRAVIEFKRSMNLDHLSGDVERLREIAKWAHPPQYTLLATYSIGKGHERLARKMDDLCDGHGITKLASVRAEGSWGGAWWKPMQREILYALFEVTRTRG